MIRRDFLKNMGLLGALTAAPATVLHAAGGKTADKFTTVVRGKVQNNGKGIAGVGITDGITITTTDKDGRYELVTGKGTKFVYMTLPAGYQIPNDKSVANFYKKIDHAGGTFNADFQLQPLTGSDDKHAFVVWADTQMISKEDARLLKTTAAPDLKDLAATLPANMPIHGIGCGDLVWDKFELFADYKEALAITGVPFFSVIGNHDMDISARADDFSAETFQENFGPTYYAFNRGKAHYIVLDDVFFVGLNKKYIGYLTEQQFMWLEKDLQTVPKGSLVIVSLHIPTQTGNARRNNLKEEEMGGSVTNRKRLYELLKGHNVHIMSGHTHFNEVWTEGNITEHVHGTVCGAWWTVPICSDGTPNGYGYYEVDGDALKWQYKSTGKPLDHQLRIYPKNTEHTATDELVVNIWNWDPMWKTEWLEDGVSRGPLTRRMGYDPMAITLFRGKTLPAKHPFVEPTLTDHLFFLKPAATAKTIAVKATDRWGKTYTAEQQLG